MLSSRFSHYFKDGEEFLLYDTHDEDDGMKLTRPVQLCLEPM